MFTLITQEHRMIREAARKVFSSLHDLDTEKRQRDDTRIAGADVGRALSELGLFDTGSDDATMLSAQIQASLAVEAGATALPFPVLEMLAAHALSQGPCNNTANTSSLKTLTTTSISGQQIPVIRDQQLSGIAQAVPFTHLSDYVVVNATLEGRPVLAEVRLAQGNFTRVTRASVEPDYPFEDLHFDGAVATLLESQPQASDDLTVNVHDFLRERTALLAAAEIAGACRSMVTMTRDYLLLRTQFGQPLAANQVLKHAMADNHVRVEALMAAIDYAAAAIDAGDSDAASAVIAAKGFANRAGKAVADSTLQMHGAIGYTMEFPLHLLMRRVHRLTASFETSRSLADQLFNLFERECVHG